MKHYFIFPPSNYSSAHIYYRALAHINVAESSVAFVVPVVEYDNPNSRHDIEAQIFNSFAFTKPELSAFVPGGPTLFSFPMFLDRLKRISGVDEVEIIFISPSTDIQVLMLDTVCSEIEHGIVAPTIVRVDVDEDYGIMDFELEPTQYVDAPISREDFANIRQNRLFNIYNSIVRISDASAVLHKESADAVMVLSSPSGLLLHLISKFLVPEGGEELVTEVVPNVLPSSVVVNTYTALRGKLTARNYFLCQKHQEYLVDKSKNQVKDQYKIEFAIPKGEDKLENLSFELMKLGDTMTAPARVLVSGLAHDADWKYLAGIIEKFRAMPEGKDSVFVFIGNIPRHIVEGEIVLSPEGIELQKYIAQGIVEYHEPVPFPMYYQKLLAVEANMALILINPEHAFNYTKSYLKLEEYFKLGIPTIFPQTIAPTYQGPQDEESSCKWFVPVNKVSFEKVNGKWEMFKVGDQCPLGASELLSEYTLYDNVMIDQYNPTPSVRVVFGLNYMGDLGKMVCNTDIATAYAEGLAEMVRTKLHIYVPKEAMEGSIIPQYDSICIWRTSPQKTVELLNGEIKCLTPN